MVNSFLLHVFDLDAATYVAVIYGKSFCFGCFRWARPLSSCCFVALETKRKSGWGICGSSWCGLSWVVLLWFCLMICLFHRYRPIALSTAFFTAYVVIRTVPQSINGQTRGKKKVVLVWFVCCVICVMICHLMVSANCAVYRFFTAYVVIRTVPQSIYGQTRRKKNGVQCDEHVVVVPPWN